jgi:hypothetical protein
LICSCQGCSNVWDKPTRNVNNLHTYF